MAALANVTQHAAHNRSAAMRRWTDARGGDPIELDEAARRFAAAGRLTVNFHPDRMSRSGFTVANGLLADGRYRSQWATGISNGSRSAVRGGIRHGFERHLFASAYDGADPSVVDFPVYGAFDLLQDPFGGSPRFGSSHLVLHRHVLTRTTMCVGDSHEGPTDVGTAESPWALLAGLAEQDWLPADIGALLDGRARADQPSRRLDGYTEAQVHGGVDLTTDVEAVVVDPSFHGTQVGDDLQLASARYGFSLRWHTGSELDIEAVPADFRGPTMPTLAQRIARPDGIVDACAIGVAARTIPWEPPATDGDPPESEIQQLKYLWHTVLAFGRDA